MREALNTEKEDTHPNRATVQPSVRVDAPQRDWCGAKKLELMAKVLNVLLQSLEIVPLFLVR